MNSSLVAKALWANRRPEASSGGSLGGSMEWLPADYGVPYKMDRCLGNTPLVEGVNGSVLVGEDDEPKDELVGGFGGFVAEFALSEEGPGPAAEEFEKVQGVFRRSPG